jgi:lysophospholipase L1-like esterase
MVYQLLFMNIRTAFFLPLFSLFFVISADDQETVAGKSVLGAKELLPYGRTDLVNNQLELISSAVHFGFSFEGSECEIYISVPDWMDHNYLQYELDGVYQKRIKISKDQKQPIRLPALNGGKHTVWIYKATEATTGPVFIEKISGKNLKVLPASTAPLIEFIGNSITCGAAADTSEMPCGTGAYHDYHNAYYAYGPRVARSLGANYILSSVSGIGIYRTWNREEPSMPQVYDKADFQLESTRPWDFSKYNPQIVSIALGTNDLSNGDGKTSRAPFDSARFVNSYISFVQFVKSKYPAAQIVLLNSPMVHGERNALLQNCLMAVRKKIDSLYASGKPVALFFFKPMQARGCTGHPSVEDHAILADALLPFLKSLLSQ